MDKEIISIKNVKYSYETATVLRDVSFQVKKGEKVVILGVNGSGKSTLLKVLNGLIFPSEGEYLYKGERITEKKLKDKAFNKKFRKEVVLLFQSPDSMLFNPTVYDEIAFGLRQLGEDKKVIDEKVRYWADKIGIYRHLDKPPFNLSGGEKQKVCLASLLVLEPELMLLDEPTSNLDPRSTGWFIDFLYELDKTVITTTHNLGLAVEMGERGIVLSENHTVIYDGCLKGFLKDRDKLIEANLVHIHKHRHGKVEHSHYHTHLFFD
ncbi:energy-coupling factor ABC transporter ATP-binding protein [Persephonella atlantica]|uniref:energy-coupling factor ABC transporter ATP-binding protein n=1 Tax=Persephonella atlantica TaxID=2699429 RepID=UPI001A924F2E|nr:ABC transporter ATP-binding protein [Persephonella atlantica]